MTPHYAHKHVIPVDAECCAPCDCYLCTLDRRRMRDELRFHIECSVERVIEEIETQLQHDGETSIMGVWNALTGWTRQTGRWSDDSPVSRGEVVVVRPSLGNVVQNVFKSLDRHGLIVCARHDRAGKRCMAWKESHRRASSP